MNVGHKDLLAYSPAHSNLEDILVAAHWDRSRKVGFANRRPGRPAGSPPGHKGLREILRGEAVLVLHALGHVDSLHQIRIVVFHH